MKALHDTLHIGRFQARHHVADEAGQRRARAAQQRLLDGALEAALARVAAPDELVLLRRLSARVVLGAAGSDDEDARAWSDALLLSLERTLQHAGPQELLRFARPQQALQRFAEDALHDDATRDWAWQRLGLLPVTPTKRNSPTQRRQALLHRLADDDEASVPLLRSLLAGAAWPVLVARLHEDELRGLAQTVLLRLAGRGALRFETGFDAGTAAAPAAAPEPGDPGEAELPPWWPATLQAAGRGARARWALRLAALLSAPALARRGAAAVDTRLQQWAAVAGGLDDAVAAVAGPGAGRASQAGAAGGAPAGARRAAGASGPETAGALRPRAAPVEARDAASRGAPTTPAPQPSEAEDIAIGRTRHGGLLFLAPLLPACGVLALLEDAALWPDLPQALHTLARHLAPLPPDDPAALAFCGLAPQQRPPEPLPPSPTRQAALQAAQERLVDHLSQRLPDWRGPGLLPRVLLREARIEADPGWIEVHFSLRDVATELRRAALDLDPGFLPWLGVVMRFRYE